MRVVINKSEVSKLHKKLVAQLREFETERIRVFTGHKGENFIKKVSYSAELNIWWDMGDTVEGNSGRRYWNAFGIGKPDIERLDNIICEINYPVEGVNKRVAANWVVEGNDALLVHSGKIGGGRAGIGKNGFIKHYSGVFEQIDIDDLPEKITVVGKLGDISLPFQIKNFIYEVARIKDIIVKKPFERKKTPLQIIEHSFNEEFVGTKEYKGKKRKISSTVNHGLIVNTLKECITSKGYLVANDQQRDLYIYNKKASIETVFEIKTSLTSQSIFTAVGQLLVNNIKLKPAPKLIFVIPEKPNFNLMKTLKELQIEVSVYAWEKGRPKFKNLDTLL
jgi:hypothetical protein